MNNQISDFIKEFMRYVFVGGSAFFLDFGIMCLFKELIFGGNHLYVAIFIGYAVGLTYNFFLSNWYVFKNGFKKIKGKEIRIFILFGIIGVIGLGLTEILMYFFVKIMAIWYIFAKMLSSGIVLFWNYGARRFIIYK